jgi:hypothetical protein
MFRAIRKESSKIFQCHKYQGIISHMKQATKILKPDTVIIDEYNKSVTYQLPRLSTKIHRKNRTNHLNSLQRYHINLIRKSNFHMNGTLIDKPNQIFQTLKQLNICKNNSTLRHIQNQTHYSQIFVVSSTFPTINTSNNILVRVLKTP